MYLYKILEKYSSVVGLVQEGLSQYQRLTSFTESVQLKSFPD